MQVLLKFLSRFLHFFKSRQRAHVGLVPLTPLMTRTNATGLEEKEVREGVLLLVLLVLEAIVQALLGSEVTRTPESFHWFNLKNTPIVNMPISV